MPSSQLWFDAPTILFTLWRWSLAHRYTFGFGTEPGRDLWISKILDTKSGVMYLDPWDFVKWPESKDFECFVL